VLENMSLGTSLPMVSNATLYSITEQGGVVRAFTLPLECQVKFIDSHAAGAIDRRHGRSLPHGLRDDDQDHDLHPAARCVGQGSSVGVHANQASLRPGTTASPRPTSMHMR
jgi:hypothetical protein